MKPSKRKDAKAVALAGIAVNIVTTTKTMRGTYGMVSHVKKL